MKARTTGHAVGRVFRPGTASAFPVVDDGFPEIEAEGALADDDDRRALQALVDRAAHAAGAVADDGAERLGPVLVVRRQAALVGREALRIERPRPEMPDENRVARPP